MSLNKFIIKIYSITNLMVFTVLCIINVYIFNINLIKVQTVWLFEKRKLHSFVNRRSTYFYLGQKLMFVSLVYCGWKYYSLVYCERKTLLDDCWFYWSSETNRVLAGVACMAPQWPNPHHRPHRTAPLLCPSVFRMFRSLGWWCVCENFTTASIHAWTTHTSHDTARRARLEPARSKTSAALSSTCRARSQLTIWRSYRHEGGGDDGEINELFIDG
jgi:hypothetical protein